MLSAIASYSSTSVTHLGLWAHLQQPLATTAGRNNSKRTEPNIRTVRAQRRNKNLRTFKQRKKVSTHVCHYDLAPKELYTNRSLYLIEETTGIQNQQGNNQLRKLSKEIVKVNNESSKQINQKGTAKRRQCKC